MAEDIGELAFEVKNSQALKQLNDLDEALQNVSKSSSNASSNVSSLRNNKINTKDLQNLSNTAKLANDTDFNSFNKGSRETIKSIKEFQTIAFTLSSLDFSKAEMSIKGISETALKLTEMSYGLGEAMNDARKNGVSFFESLKGGANTMLMGAKILAPLAILAGTIGAAYLVIQHLNTTDSDRLKGDFSIIDKTIGYTSAFFESIGGKLESIPYTSRGLEIPDKTKDAINAIENAKKGFAGIEKVNKNIYEFIKYRQETFDRLLSPEIVGGAYPTAKYQIVEKLLGSVKDNEKISKAYTEYVDALNKFTSSEELDKMSDAVNKAADAYVKTVQDIRSIRASLAKQWISQRGNEFFDMSDLLRRDVENFLPSGSKEGQKKVLEFLSNQVKDSMKVVKTINDDIRKMYMRQSYAKVMDKSQSFEDFAKEYKLTVDEQAKLKVEAEEISKLQNNYDNAKKAYTMASDASTAHLKEMNDSTKFTVEQINAEREKSTGELSKLEADMNKAGEAYIQKYSTLQFGFPVETVDKIYSDKLTGINLKIKELEKKNPKLLSVDTKGIGSAIFDDWSTTYTNLIESRNELVKRIKEQAGKEAAVTPMVDSMVNPQAQLAPITNAFAGVSKAGEELNKINGQLESFKKIHGLTGDITKDAEILKESSKSVRDNYDSLKSTMNVIVAGRTMLDAAIASAFGPEAYKEAIKITEGDIRELGEKRNAYLGIQLETNNKIIGIIEDAINKATSLQSTLQTAYEENTMQAYAIQNRTTGDASVYSQLIKDAFKTDDSISKQIQDNTRQTNQEIRDLRISTLPILGKLQAGVKIENLQVR